LNIFFINLFSIQFHFNLFIMSNLTFFNRWAQDCVISIKINLNNIYGIVSDDINILFDEGLKTFYNFILHFKENEFTEDKLQYVKKIYETFRTWVKFINDSYILDGKLIQCAPKFEIGEYEF